MYIIFRRLYYKICVILGIAVSIFTGILLYLAIVRDVALFYAFIAFSYCVVSTLYYLVKYLKKDLDYVALRIDDNGMFLCSKKDEGTYIPWEKIKLVIFVVANNGSKIIIRQHNKETCEFLLTHYFHCFRPKSVINAAYMYADDKKKTKEVRDDLALSYETIMWRISKTEVKHES
jgi:hypothetical protein